MQYCKYLVLWSYLYVVPIQPGHPSQSVPAGTGKVSHDLLSLLPQPPLLSFPPPDVTLQLLQLLLHQVGLGRGLRELQGTVSNSNVLL